jgi:hypothetical protein
MSMIKKIATAGAVAAMGLGFGAASASAYSIDALPPNSNPFMYTSVDSSTHTFTVGGAYQITCDVASFTGDATGAATTAFAPTYTNCTFFGFPASVTAHGPWSITVTGGSGSNFTGQVDIPSTSSVTISVPIAGCNVTVPGGQTFANGVGNNVGTADNVAGGVELTAIADGIVYNASGCPFSSGTDGIYDTGGVVEIPGIEIN